MADPYELLQDPRGEQDENLNTRLVRVFRFPPSRFPVFTHPLVPQYGDPHPTYPDALVRHIKADPVAMGGIDGWNVTIEYNTVEGSGTITPLPTELGSYQWSWTTAPFVQNMPVAHFATWDIEGATVIGYKVIPTKIPAASIECSLSIVAHPPNFPQMMATSGQVNKLHNLRPFGSPQDPPPNSGAANADPNVNWWRFLGGDVGYMGADRVRITYRWEHDNGSYSPQEPDASLNYAGSRRIVAPEVGATRTAVGTLLHRPSFAQWVTVPSDIPTNPPDFRLVHPMDFSTSPNGYQSLPAVSAAMFGT